MPGQYLVEPTCAGSPRTDGQKVRQHHFPAAHRLRWKLQRFAPLRRICREVNANLTSEKRSNKSDADSEKFGRKKRSGARRFSQSNVLLLRPRAFLGFWIRGTGGLSVTSPGAGRLEAPFTTYWSADLQRSPPGCSRYHGREASQERPNRQRSDSSRARSRMLMPSSTTSSDAVSGTRTRSTFA
jgi:hypothetical protein